MSKYTEYTPRPNFKRSIDYEGVGSPVPANLQFSDSEYGDLQSP